MWQTQTQIVTKQKNSNTDNSITDQTSNCFFGKNNLTPWQLIRCTLGSVLQSCDVLNRPGVAGAVLQTALLLLTDPV